MKLIRVTLLALPTFLISAPSVFAAATTIDDSNYAKLSDLVVIFANIVSLIATFAGFAVLIMLIRGGIGYITAQGDPKALQSARGTITWAIIGLIVILSAYLIIATVMGFVSVPGIGSFCLPKEGTPAATYCK